MTQSKRQQILDAALTLFVEQGLEGAATSKIAKAAKVANGTLFHHFENKQELISELYLQIKQQMADEINFDAEGSPIPEQAEKIWHQAMRWSLDNPDKLRFLLAYYQSPFLTSQAKKKAKFETLSMVWDMIEEGQKQGIIADYPLELMMEVCHTLFMTSAAYLIDHPDAANDPRQQHAALSLFWNAMAKTN